MSQGYIKFWRKAQDSSSWNRGLMYQGLIINLLCRAAWKKGSYQGRDILPGQFGAVMSHLAESLGVPRSTLQRMVAHLEADDFLKVENMGNRFVVITIVNWNSYQESEKESWATGGQPTVNQRATGGQPSIRNKEGKKERKEEKKESKEPSGPSAPSPAPKKTFSAMVAEYTPDERLRSVLGDFIAMRQRIRAPLTNAALELTFRKLTEFAGSDETLKVRIVEQSVEKSWRSVFPLDDATARASPRGQPLKTFAQMAEDSAFDGFDRMVAEWEREKESQHGTV